MQRLLIASCITLALFVGATSLVPVAYAAVGDQCQDANGKYLTDAKGNPLVQQTKDPSSCAPNAPDVGATNAADAATAISNNAAATNQPVDLASNDQTDQAYDGIMQKILILFAWLLGVAVVTLDNAVYYTVVTMGSFVKNLSAIGVAWRILRDIGNIALIFGFLSIGISIILGTERLGYGKKMLPMLLVAAVFLNFSLFFAEAIIDTGNLFATQFYTQINGGQPATAQDFFNANNVGKSGIANRIMGQLGFAQLYGEAIKPNTSVYQKGNPWIIGFMGILLFLVTAFVMFTLAFILVARFVALIFLIVLSPIGFAGLAIPQMKKKADQWWSRLFEQTITAPILLLMLYIALAVITDTNFLTGFCPQSATSCSPSLFGFISGNITGFGSMLLSFIVAMGLLLAVTIQAKKLSAFGADWAGRTAGKLTFGMTAVGLRTGVGWPAQALSQRIRGSAFGATKRGRIIATTFDKVAKTSFDVRGAALGGGLKAIGVNAGEAQKGGYREREKKGIAGHEEYAKSLTGRGRTKEEDRLIAEAEKVKKVAQDKHKSAQEKHRIESEKVAEHEAEVQRLEAIDRENKKTGTYDQKTIADLRKAQQNLSSSRAGLDVAGAELKKAEEDLDEAEKAHKTKESEIKEKTSTKGLQKSYGENIQNSPIRSWALFGSGGQIAAKNIIREASKKQTDAEKFLEEMKKNAKKQAEEEAKKNPTPPPAPPVAPPHP